MTRTSAGVLKLRRSVLFIALLQQYYIRFSMKNIDFLFDTLQYYI